MTDPEPVQWMRLDASVPSLGLMRGDYIYLWEKGRIGVARVIVPDEPGWQALRGLLPPEKPTLYLVDPG